MEKQTQQPKEMKKQTQKPKGMERETDFLKLLSVSKLFNDSHIPLLYKKIKELEEENEKLKLEVLWRDRSVSNLRQAMRGSNILNIQCNCQSCEVAGRTDEYMVIDNDKTCTFVPWFMETMTSLGLTTGPILCDTRRYEHISDRFNCSWDVNCHIVCFGRRDFVHFSYGKKLLDAKNVNDPEIMKLQKLFSILDPDYDSDGNEIEIDP
jgi:hypothetical protein